ncbi:GNAT family N-acetyltransferase [Clostridium sp. UBA6640]|uniref:GNAT family N-acetyltransferase n=1 Tax=Clostridium sp. UBA6640 TaxID=1946370 RepID=UPI0025C2104E|nr:GNAT family N-acetyltransferase [Clostridium sp. UBA6640]
MIIAKLATLEDIDELINMNYEFNGVKVSYEKVRESLKRNNELVAVSIADDKIIGFACAQYNKSFCYEEFSGEITELYVKKDFRRMGAASTLISYLEKELRSLGVKDIKIITNIKNEAAQKIYTALNYKLKNWVVFHS